LLRGDGGINQVRGSCTLPPHQLIEPVSKKIERFFHLFNEKAQV
jgi:hypothetical protein